MSPSVLKWPAPTSFPPSTSRGLHWTTNQEQNWFQMQPIPPNQCPHLETWEAGNFHSKPTQIPSIAFIYVLALFVPLGLRSSLHLPCDSWPPYTTTTVRVVWSLPMLWANHLCNVLLGKASFGLSTYSSTHVPCAWSLFVCVTLKSL